MTENDALSAAGEFLLPGRAVLAKPFGKGHINSTYLIRCEGGEGFVLQRINTAVFGDVKGMTENILAVTAHLRRAAAARGDDAERAVLSLVRTRTGEYYTDTKAGVFRATRLVENTYSYEKPGDRETVREAGNAFGRFFADLADFPADSLADTIPDFHNTEKRCTALAAAAGADVCGRVRSAARELDFAAEHIALASALTGAGLPLRVTHNDTKLNNLLFDRDTKKPVCIVDLDTVMKGFAACDFGDGIRTGTITAEEDERELSAVHFDAENYRAYLDGYLTGAGEALTAAEKASLPTGAKTMTYEVFIRFLTDYLAGDTYFRTDYAEHNLVRCRTQMKLLSEMEEKI